MKITLEKLIINHIDNAQVSNLTWDEYLNSISPERKIKGEIKYTINPLVWDWPWEIHTISLAEVVSKHIDEAKILKMNWFSYFMYLWYKDLIESKIESSLNQDESWK